MRNNLFLTILDGSENDLTLNLADFNKDFVTFGRTPDNDLPISNNLVSRHHGYFQYVNGSWMIFDGQSTNGLLWNGRKVKQCRLNHGFKLLIGREQNAGRVVLMFSTEDPKSLYQKIHLTGNRTVTIGRSPNCTICVSHPSVFNQHCRVVSNEMGVVLEGRIDSRDSRSSSSRMLHDNDSFLVGNIQFLYKSRMLHFSQIPEGLNFEVSHLCKVVGRGNKQKKINNDISFSVNSGEFVAIIGGSGAGKSTLLNCLCGCSKISSGNVTINGEDLTENFTALKDLIGYVPQQDIVYKDLTLERMLYYSAKLRMASDITDAEFNQRIQSALDMVELSEYRGTMIRSLSGGQKKRASIAVELLSDPKLFFLDEPTSGLDPGTERNLMKTLKTMSQNGKTVVLVTHTPLNLHLCDKVVVLGKGGRLCYCGSPGNARRYFGVQEFTDIYDLVNRDSEGWAARYAYGSLTPAAGQEIHLAAPQSKGKRKSNLSYWQQFWYLMVRYVDLVLHDKIRLLIQMLMAPGLGLLLYLAFANGFPFLASYDTQKLTLTFACCAYWVGLFNSIQEICKESQIFRREHMAGLKLVPYVSSKLVVISLMDLVQCAMMVLVVQFTLGLPQSGMLWPNLPFAEIFVTTYLTMLSATCLGLAVSAVVGNSDQAISIAPILLIPQILFSGIIVDLEGSSKAISRLISCRYACVAYCTTADINNLPSQYTLTVLGMEAGDVEIIDSVYSFTAGVNSTLEGLFGESVALAVSNPISTGWISLVGLCLICAAATLILLKQKDKLR